MIRWWAAAWSVLAGCLGAWWLVTPSSYPFGPTDPHGDLSLLAWSTPGQASAVLVVAAPVGVVVALLGRGPLAVSVAAVYAVCSGVLAPDIQLLILLTYVVTAVGPVVLVGALLVGATGSPRRALAVVAGVASVLASLRMQGLLDLDVLDQLAVGLWDAGRELGTRPLVVAFLAAGGVLWAWAGLTIRREDDGRCGWCGRDGADWTTPSAAARWGRRVTVAAALGPVPYVVVRSTWLLPTGWRIAPASVDADPGLRLWGLLIGVVALGGSVLTLGLAARWGEVWPEWLPATLRGRSVPPMLPVALAGVVAFAVTIGGVSVTRQAVETGDWSDVLLMPFPLWGPLLGAAAVAYHLRRRDDCRRCGRGSALARRW